MEKNRDSRLDAAALGPLVVGTLLLLYAVGLVLMSDGEANPSLVLLFLVLGAAALGWGLYRRSRV